MTDQELRTEIRRGLLIIIRALMKRYAMTWLDFIPADDRESFTITITSQPKPGDPGFLVITTQPPNSAY